VAGNFYGDIRGEWGGAGFEVAEVPIEGGKGRAGADDAKVDRDAASLAEKVLRSMHQFAAQAGALAPGIDTQKAKVSTVATKLDVDASSQSSRIFGDEKFTLGHVRANAWGVDAITIDVGLFHAKGGIDQRSERINVASDGDADMGVCRSGYGVHNVCHGTAHRGALLDYCPILTTFGETGKRPA
jgi:hypothetical protein